MPNVNILNDTQLGRPPKGQRDWTATQRQLAEHTLGEYILTTAESDAGIVFSDLDTQYPPGNVLRYGATADGVTDDYTAFHNAQLQMQEDTGANMVIPPGQYLLSTQWIVTAPAFKRVSIWAYGAEIITSGAISALELTGGATTGGCSVYGLQVNHRDNSDATSGFDIYEAWNMRLTDCSVESYDTKSTYSSYLLRQSDTTDANTGAFWTLLDRCHNRRQSSGDGTRVPIAVQIRGACNATEIRGGNLGDADIGILHTFETGQTRLANAVILTGVAFEGFTSAYKMLGVASTTYNGPRIIGCRFESGTTAFELATIDTEFAAPPFLMGNYYVSSVTNHTVNPNSLGINIFDFAETPNLDQAELHNDDGLKIFATAAGAGIDLVPVGGTGGGFGIWDNANASRRVWMDWTSGSTGEVQALGNMSYYMYPLVFLSSGSGTPESAITASPGSLYTDTGGGGGTTLYVKESGTGNTGWVAK